MNGGWLYENCEAAMSYLCDGINIVDACHAALRFTNSAPTQEHIDAIMAELSRQATAKRRAVQRSILSRSGEQG